MHTSTRFSVAVHILTMLALAQGESQTSQVIAESVNTNPVVIRRILGYLRRGGLVMSESGKAGGWRLLRQPHEITLRDVYRLVEDEQSIALNTPHPACAIGRGVTTCLIGIIDTAQTALEASLATTTIADMYANVQATL